MSRWLDVEVGTDDIELNTLPSNVVFADLQCDNEMKLVVGDFGRGEVGPKLKVFRGAIQTSEIALPDLPVGVAVVPAGDSGGRAPPLLAVGFASAVFLYRNMKLFYKYYLPDVQLSTTEIQVWKQLTDPANHNAESIAKLTESLSAIPKKILSAQSVSFLSMEAGQRLEYVEQGGAGAAGAGGAGGTQLVALTTLPLASHSAHSQVVLVLATEQGDVIVLDTQTFTLLTQAKVCSTKKTPFQVVTTGLYNVDYKIIVATREQSICVVWRGCSSGRRVAALGAPAVALQPAPHTRALLVLCADHTLASYTIKGRRQWVVQLGGGGVSLCSVAVAPAATWLAGVALATGAVRLYDTAATLRDSFFLNQAGSVMKFGRLGREDHVLVIITADGNLMLKILKRTAEFTEEAAGGAGVAGGAGGGAGAGPPWSLPKKSRLLLEQAHRERDAAPGMAGGLQLEVWRMRVVAGRALLAVLGAQHHAVAHHAHLALSAQVSGLGPRFVVRVRARNTSRDAPLRALALLFHMHSSHYKVAQPYIKVPLVGPGGSVELPTIVEEVFPEGAGAELVLRAVTAAPAPRLSVLAVREGGGPGVSVVVVAATIPMPHTHPALLPESLLDAADTFTHHHDDDAALPSPAT